MQVGNPAHAKGAKDAKRGWRSFWELWSLPDFSLRLRAPARVLSVKNANRIFLASFTSWRESVWFGG